MKKFLALIIALVMALSLVACGEQKQPDNPDVPDDGQQTATVKVGFITLHDENSTYDLNFINAAKEAIANLGLTDADYILKTNVPEGQECYETAMNLVDDGCNIIFADSFGHEPYMIDAAKAHPEVQFCHSTGNRAHTEGLANYHNAFASIYEGRYLAGIAAGLKLNEMIEAGKFTADEAKMGYVGAFTYAEVVSGYTSFYLGAKSVCPTVTMDVTFTGSWYDETLEKEGAEKLIQGGCKLISQHADSLGAPTACENAGVPNVSYNGSTKDACPNTFIVSSRIDWAPYYEMCIKAVMDGTEIPADWTGTLATGSVVLTDVNETAAAAGTAEAIAAATEKLEKGEIHVFDCSTFTVKGETLTSYQADVNADSDNTPDTEVVHDGYFSESEFRSAPYFDLEIDGITRLDVNFG
ncbi:MAG: BMP family ABC transporter substrate-binding protein [Oscillospiraceae bacterium]|nr:BMP family ABC transporter substrate-binding protein [Oscillospiraceae bacterium]